LFQTGLAEKDLENQRARNYERVNEYSKHRHSSVEQLVAVVDFKPLDLDKIERFLYGPHIKVEN
jgi:hypothetical protein